MQSKQTELDALLSSARAIFAKADGERRHLTDDERWRVEDTLNHAQTLRDQRDLETAIAGLGTISSVHAGSGRPVYLPATPNAEFGHKFAAGFADGVRRFAETWSRKDFTMADDSGMGDAGGLTFPAVEPAVFLPTEPNVASLFAQAPLTGTDRFTYLKETPVSNGAVVVARGGEKPETNIGASRVEGIVETIAHRISDVDNSDLADSNFLVELINRRGSTGLLAALDDEVLNGDGTPGTHLTGVLNDGDIQTSGGAADVLTSLRDGVTDLRMVNVVPNAVIVNPTDAAAIDTLRDSDVFLIGQPGSPGAPWGVKIVQSTLMSAGSALMGDFNMARLYMRSGVAVLADPYTKFSTNQTSFRFELRAGLAVLRGDGFTLVDLGTSSGT